MRKLFIFGILLATHSLKAEISGTYRCKNSDKYLSDNIYRIENIKIGETKNISQPHLLSKRYFREIPGNLNSPIIENEIKGFPVVFSTTNRTVFQLAGMTIEFLGDQLGERVKE